MAYEPAGMADKLGNRFEKRWVVSQLLLLLADTIQSVQYEPVGPDEQGVDLWIVGKQGNREAQQCKGELSTKPQWSMADLHAKGILKNLRFQLDRAEQHEFALVSATPATSFRDLSRMARTASDAASFKNYQVEGQGKLHREEFQAFCRYLELDPNTADDLHNALGLLRRCHYHPFSDDSQTERSMEASARYWAIGEPGRILDALAAFVEKDCNFRRVLHADEVWAYLREKGHPPRELSRDNRLPIAIEGLTGRFLSSIQPHLVAGTLIPRQETKSIIRWIANPGMERVLLLHGPAGSGKSGILYELVGELKKLGIPLLPLRLDRQRPRINPERFGQGIGLPDSPALSLQASAGDRRGVLLLDQLDALRWTSSHSSEAFEICQEVIRQAVRPEKGLLVIAGCRTFDLEHDPQLKLWLKEDKLARRVNVGPIDEASVAAIMQRFGADPGHLTARERRLLANVQNLTMWAEIAATGRHTRFSTVTELNHLFWRSRREEMIGRGIAEPELNAVLEKLANYMDGDCQLYAPKRLLDRHHKVATELQSLNILQIEGEQVSFCHQSYLDYLVTQSLLDALDNRATTVLGWLGDRSKQSLFRREQVRLLLARLRDENPARFLVIIRDLLFSPNVRFHLKQICFQQLASIESPAQQEIDFIL